MATEWRNRPPSHGLARRVEEARSAPARLPSRSTTCRSTPSSHSSLKPARNAPDRSHQPGVLPPRTQVPPAPRPGSVRDARRSTCSMDSPAASFSRILSTVTRVPETTGFPCITPGSEWMDGCIRFPFVALPRRPRNCSSTSPTRMESFSTIRPPARRVDPLPSRGLARTLPGFPATLAPSGNPAS